MRQQMPGVTGLQLRPNPALRSMWVAETEAWRAWFSPVWALQIRHQGAVREFKKGADRAASRQGALRGLSPSGYKGISD